MYLFYKHYILFNFKSKMQRYLIFCASWLLSDVNHFSYSLSESWGALVYQAPCPMFVSIIASCVSQNQNVTSEHSSGPVVMVMLTLDRPSTSTLWHQPLSLSSLHQHPIHAVQLAVFPLKWFGPVALLMLAEPGLSKNPYPMTSPLSLRQQHRLSVL